MWQFIIFSSMIVFQSLLAGDAAAAQKDYYCYYVEGADDLKEEESGAVVPIGIDSLRPVVVQASNAQEAVDIQWHRLKGKVEGRSRANKRKSFNPNLFKNIYSDEKAFSLWCSSEARSNGKESIDAEKIEKASFSAPRSGDNTFSCYNRYDLPQEQYRSTSKIDADKKSGSGIPTGFDSGVLINAKDLNTAEKLGWEYIRSRAEIYLRRTDSGFSQAIFKKITQKTLDFYGEPLASREDKSTPSPPVVH